MLSVLYTGKSCVITSQKSREGGGLWMFSTTTVCPCPAKGSSEVFVCDFWCLGIRAMRRLGTPLPAKRGEEIEK